MSEFGAQFTFAFLCWIVWCWVMIMLPRCQVKSIDIGMRHSNHPSTRRVRTKKHVSMMCCQRVSCSTLWARMTSRWAVAKKPWLTTIYTGIIRYKCQRVTRQLFGFPSLFSHQILVVSQLHDYCFQDFAVWVNGDHWLHSEFSWSNGPIGNPIIHVGVVLKPMQGF